ncbi:MAG: hypothetical protein R3B71_00585 [Candidatus Gracilibacteria bacterium]|nr:hypothetical protein [Candidatus Peregrinibacteria bacterium]
MDNSDEIARRIVGRMHTITVSERYAHVRQDNMWDTMLSDFAKKCPVERSLEIRIAVVQLMSNEGMVGSSHLIKLGDLESTLQSKLNTLREGRKEASAKAEAKVRTTKKTPPRGRMVVSR